jgi:hypothetical protein
MVMVAASRRHDDQALTAAAAVVMMMVVSVLSHLNFLARYVSFSISAFSANIAFGIGSNRSAQDRAFRTSVGSEGIATCAMLSDASAPTAPNNPAIFLSIFDSISD